MNALLAAYHVVQDYPGGAVVLGPVLGKAPATLSHEVNPGNTAFKLGLHDAITLSVWTRDLRIATAFAAQVGCMLLPLPDGGKDGTTAEDFAVMAREFSGLLSGIAEATADGAVTTNEQRSVERAAGQLVAAIQAAVAHTAGKVRQPRDAQQKTAA